MEGLPINRFLFLAMARQSSVDHKSILGIG